MKDGRCPKSNLDESLGVMSLGVRSCFLSVKIQDLTPSHQVPQHARLEDDERACGEAFPFQEENVLYHQVNRCNPFEGSHILNEVGGLCF